MSCRSRRENKLTVRHRTPAHLGIQIPSIPGAPIALPLVRPFLLALRVTRFFATRLRTSDLVPSTLSNTETQLTHSFHSETGCASLFQPGTFSFQPVQLLPLPKPCLSTPRPCTRNATLSYRRELISPTWLRSKKNVSVAQRPCLSFTNPFQSRWMRTKPFRSPSFSLDLATS